MREFDLSGMMIEKFQSHIDTMDEAISAQQPAAESGNQKLFLQLFVPRAGTAGIVDKISFMRLEDGMIKNKDDKHMLDPGEFTVITCIPSDRTALPVLTMEGSVHFDKYIQCRADIVPVSSSDVYRAFFCEPVKRLRQGLEPLQGLYPQTTLPGLEQFSSGGLLTAHLEPAHRATALNWFSQYIDLYLSFVDRYETFPVLKDPEVTKEAIQKKRMFCKMFAGMAPKILSDLPDLHSDELSRKIAEALF